jgi:hypothetical protein
MHEILRNKYMGYKMIYGNKSNKCIQLLLVSTTM